MKLPTSLHSALLAAALAVLAAPADAAPFAAAAVVPPRSTGPGSAWPRPSLRCTGAEAPTLILDSGGESLGLWSRVQAQLAAGSRVCVWNAGAPEPAATDAVALHAALRAAGESGPYLRVAHGRGGDRAVAFAMRYPDEVLGLALVDVPALAAGPALPDELLLAVVSSAVPADALAGGRLDIAWQHRQAALAALSAQSFHFVGDSQRGLLPERDPETVATALDWLRRQVQLAATVRDAD